MIIFGFMARLPISFCFLAPAIPGLILVVFLTATHLAMSRRIRTIHVLPRVGFRRQCAGVIKSGSSASLGLLLPIVVLGGIYGGFYTPMEAAGIGVLYCVIVGFLIYRTIRFRQFVNEVVDACIIIGSISALFFFFLVISRVFILEEISDLILAWMLTVSSNMWVLLGMLNILLLIMGMIIDDCSAMMISGLILLPIARGIGVDPYHFAAISCLNLGLGLITPPVAPLLYLAEMVAGTPLNTYIKPTFMYVLFAYLPTLALTIFIPALSTTLPYWVMEHT